MNMELPNLRGYISRMNRRRAYSNMPPYRIGNMTEMDAASLFINMQADLSPENLTCDGEFSAQEAREEKDRIEGAWAELESLGFSPNPNNMLG